MTNTKEDWTEAAAILQRAHDVLLEEGVSCKGTGLPLKWEYNREVQVPVEMAPIAYRPEVVAVQEVMPSMLSRTELHPVVEGSPCLWHAIAQGAGLPFGNYQALYGFINPETPGQLAGTVIWNTPTPHGIVPGTSWNDCDATEDQVFDVLVEGRKFCEEQAGKL